MKHDLEEMKVRSDEMASLLAAGLGDEDQRTLRAQEVSAAIQRLQWAMERSGRRGGVASAGGYRIRKSNE
jgi:hypothetical protein